MNNTRKGIMKKLPTILAAALTAVALTGCILTSVYPFYNEKDLAFDSTLLGTWAKPADNESWHFDKQGTHAYQLTLISGGKTNQLQAHLFKLQDQKYLDLYSPDVNWEGAV